jgi:hypothetical protein
MVRADRVRLEGLMGLDDVGGRNVSPQVHDVDSLPPQQEGERHQAQVMPFALRAGQQEPWPFLGGGTQREDGSGQAASDQL